MKSNSKKLTDGQSFFIILLFAIAGFTVIMMGTLSQSNNKNNTVDDGVQSDQELDLIARNMVLSSNIFNEFSDGILMFENKNNLDCDKCVEFSYKFLARNNTNLPQSVVGFRYEVKIVGGEIVSTNVVELIKPDSSSEGDFYD